MTTVELHPELVPLAGMVPSFQLTLEALADMRSQRSETFAALAPPLSDDVERVDHVVSEDPYVVVRVHRPKQLVGPAARLFSIHGGGYILGTYEMDDAKFDRLCVDSACVGVSVEYRLSPETPYPGPLDDCYAALRWTFDHASELGVDPSRVGITGVSVGGGLCAALALLVRDRCRDGCGVPAARMPDARRPAGDLLEPVRGSAHLVARVQHVRLAGLPRRPLRHRRGADLRGRGALPTIFQGSRPRS